MRVLAEVFLILAGSTADPAPAPPVYRPPTSGEVIQRFSPPVSWYAPGPRGVRYRTEPGSVLVAPGDGTVIFAGDVAGTFAVTIEHADGLRTTVSSIATPRVSEGAEVRAGDPIASAGPAVVLTVRAGRAYLDPLALFSTAGVSHLVT